jgi:hypothetical protein
LDNTVPLSLEEEEEFTISQMFDNFIKQKDRIMRFHQLTPYLGLWRTDEFDISEFVLNKEFMYRNNVVEYH